VCVCVCGFVLPYGVGREEGYRGDGVGHDSRPGHFGVAEIGASDVL